MRDLMLVQVIKSDGKKEYSIVSHETEGKLNFDKDDEVKVYGHKGVDRGYKEKGKDKLEKRNRNK